MYCPNCGEHWTNCICIPWCWEHDSSIPCQGCLIKERERLEKQAMLAPFMIPWYISLLHWLIGR